MAVKVGKLWSDVKFQKLSDQAKLLYLYLATSTDITVVGTLNPNLEVVRLELGFGLDTLRETTKELIDHNYIVVMDSDSVVYFIVPEHFNTIPKSQSSILKIQKELSRLPEKIVKRLGLLGIKTDAKVVEFKKPTVKQVCDYALSKGYNIDGEEFVTYYEDQSKRYGKKGVWVDGRGSLVKDWKAKLRRVWFKEDKKIKSVEGAPKGFETFNVEFEGKLGFPDSWKRGKPHSKNLALDLKLKEEYEKRKGGS